MAYGDKIWVKRNVETYLADLEDFIAGRETRIDDKIIANIANNAVESVLSQTQIYANCEYLLNKAENVGLSNSRRIKKIAKLLKEYANCEVSIIGKDSDIGVLCANRVEISISNIKNIHSDIARDLESEFKHFVGKNFNLRIYAKLGNLARIFNKALNSDIVDYVKTRANGVLSIDTSFLNKDSISLSDKEYKNLKHNIHTLLWGNCEVSDAQSMSHSIATTQASKDIKDSIIEYYNRKAYKAYDCLRYVVSIKTAKNKKSQNRVGALKFYMNYLQNLQKGLNRVYVD